MRRAAAPEVQPATVRLTRQGRNRPWTSGFLFAFVLALGLLLQVLPARAQTAVSGAIAVDTHWTSAGAPYIVSGDLVVQNGAQLTIDPGVSVFMALDASLTVQAGAIKASGTASQPIQVLSDKTRQGQAAAPGDWKQWTFNPGAVNTRFDHVVFRHGSGLAVTGSAPIFNNTSIENHQGAAMTVDLAASPSGTGNQASGNTLNGIAVPSGDITGTVKWGMRGIPYVVASGVVSVGASPKVESITPDVVQVGQTVTLALAGTRLAGLQAARFDKPGVTAQVLPGGTATQASLSVVVQAAAGTGPAALRLLTDAGEIHIDKAITLAQAQATLTSLAPSTVYVGQGGVEVTINGRDFVADSSVLVGGAPVTTTFVSGTQLRASLPAQALNTNLVVKVRSPDLANAGQYLTSNELVLAVRNAQPAVAPNAATVTKGAVRSFTVTLPFNAPAGGTTLTLVSSVPGVASVPANLLVPEGQNSASFQLTAAELGDTTVSVSRVGMTSVNVQIKVVPPPTLALTPPSLLLGVGRSAELTVTSSVPAPAGGMTIALSSSDPAKATVPASVSIPAGASSASLTVTTLAIGNTTVRAEFPEFISGTTAVSVRPVSLNMPSGVLVAPSLSRSVPITLSDPAPAGGLVVTLVSSNPAVASVPASVTVPAGATAVNFTLSGVAVGATSISASADNYQAAALPVTVDAVQIRFGNPALTSLSLPEGMKRDIAVTLSRPAPAGGVVIDVASSDPAKASLSPAQITIAEGQTSGGAVMLNVAGLVKGSTTMTASAPGLTSASIPLVVTTKPHLVFSRSTVYVGKGMTTYYAEIAINRATDGNWYSPSEPVTVTLTSSDPSKAIVPGGRLTIPAGETGVTFYVNGLDLTGGITIDASAPGYTAPTTKLTARVVAPEFVFASLEESRSPQSARDDFYISTRVAGANYSTQQTPTLDMPIDLAIVDANPEGIVDGIYTAASGGTAINQIVLKKGDQHTNSSVGYTYIGVPTAAGSYKIRASVPGVGSTTSATVNVVGPELKFSRTTLTAAKGFRTYSQEVSIHRAVNGTYYTTQNPLTVNLTSSDPSRASVPASVTIPAGYSGVYFYVTGVSPTAGTPVTIDATAAGHKAPAAKLATTVILPTITFASIDTTRATGSERDDFYVQATVPGSSYSSSHDAVEDIPVDLSIVDATPAGIVDGFSSTSTGGVPVTRTTIKKGYSNSSSANAYSFVNTPTGAGSYKVRASLQGITTADSALVTVTAPDLKFGTSTSSTSAVVTTATVAKGFNTYSQEVRIFRSAGGSAINSNAPITVALTSSDPSKVKVPATVTINAGTSGAYFLVTGVDLTGSTPVTVSATAEGHNAAPGDVLRVSVVAPVFSFNGSIELNRSPASARDAFSISASTPGARYSGSQSAAADVPISLAIVSENPAGIVPGFYSAASAGSVITELKMAQGRGNTADAYVAAPTVAGTYKVYANADGLAGVTSGTVTVSPPQLAFSTSAVTVGKGFDTYSEEARITRVVNGSSFNGSAAITVNLRCTSATICSVPPSVVIPAGASYVSFKVSGKDIGSTTVTAEAQGYSSPTQDLSVNVVTGELRLSGLGNVKVGAQSNVSAYLYLTGSPYAGSQTATSPIVVNLTSSSPGVATVPATVTIAAGSNGSPSGKLTGVAPGTTTVTASAPGLQSVTSGVITISP